MIASVHHVLGDDIKYREKNFFSENSLRMTSKCASVHSGGRHDVGMSGKKIFIKVVYIMQKVLI